jgi:hypothetical protein
MSVEIKPIHNRDGSARFFVCYVNGHHLCDRMTSAECFAAVDDLIRSHPYLPATISKP